MESLGGQLAAAPSAVSWGPDRIDVFAAGQPGNGLYQWTWNGSGWAGPTALPQLAPSGIPAEGIAAVSLGPNRLDVFAAGTGDTPWWWRWNGSSWRASVQLPPIASVPAQKVAAT